MSDSSVNKKCPSPSAPALMLSGPAWQALAAAYLSSLGVRQYAKETAGTYRLHLQRIVADLSGIFPEHCTTGDVRLALDRVRALWPDSYQSANSRSLLTNVCRSFFRWAADTAHLAHNLAESIAVRHDDGAATVPISPADILLLLRTIKSSSVCPR